MSYVFFICELVSHAETLIPVQGLQVVAIYEGVLANKDFVLLATGINTFLPSILAHQNLLALNKADLLSAGCEGLEVSGEGSRLSEGLAAQHAVVRPLVCTPTESVVNQISFFFF